MQNICSYKMGAGIIMDNLRLYEEYGNWLRRKGKSEDIVTTNEVYSHVKISGMKPSGDTICQQKKSVRQYIYENKQALQC